MSVRDEVERLLWTYVAADPKQLEADVTGEPQTLDTSEVIRSLLARINGLQDVVRMLGTEIDQLKASGSEGNR